MIVDDRSSRPGGLTPLSMSASHSYPSMAVDNAVVPPAPRVATRVLRQNRSAEYAFDAVIVEFVVQQFTVKSVPVNAFCGRPPSAGGLNRGSIQVPVHVGGSRGSSTAFLCVSLYD